MPFDKYDAEDRGVNCVLKLYSNLGYNI